MMPDDNAPATPVTEATVDLGSQADVTIAADKAPPATPKEVTENDSFDLAGLIEADDAAADAEADVAIEGDEPPAEPAAPAAPPKKEEKPKEPEPPKATAQEPAAPAPAPQPEPTPPAAPEPVQQQPQPTQAELDAQYNEWYNQSAEALETHVYKLTEEEKTALDTNPSQVLPKLAAKLHMQIFVAASTQAANMINAMLPQALERNKNIVNGVDKFFEAWPRLKEHKSVVDEFADAYMQVPANQKKTPEQAMQEVGLMASIHLKLPVEAPAQPQPGPAVPGPVTPISASGGQNAPPAAPGSNEKNWVQEVFSDEE
jgi:hypothetical protein